MKKTIFAALAALLSLGFAGCKDNGNEPEPQKTIAMSVDSVGFDVCYFTITPSDTTALYYIDARQKNYVLGKTEEEVLKELKAGLDVVIAMAADEGYQYSYADFCTSGAHTFYMDELTPATDYVLYVYYMDTEKGMPIGEVHSAPFRTGEMEVLGERNVHMTEVDFSWVESLSYWMIGATDAERKYDVMFFSQTNSQKTGTFSIENGDIEMGFLAVEEDAFSFVDATVVIAEAENEMFQITIDGLATDAYRYHITMEPAPLVLAEFGGTAPARKAPQRTIKVQE